uniref:Uncharacterized protein n=1 Tax=Chenopodium quinoa TaxID=63459 RepID=A0A803MAN3_CHEQI
MAGLQYRFFPTDFFVPTFEPTVVDSSPKVMSSSLNNSNHRIYDDDSSELSKNKDIKFNNKKFAKLSTDSPQRSITPVTKKD